MIQGIAQVRPPFAGDFTSPFGDEVESFNLDPYMYYTVSPPGGTVALELASSADFGTWVLTRFSSAPGDTGTVLVQGVTGTPWVPVYVDCGDNLNTPLDPTLQYVYQFTTATGNVCTPVLSVGCSLVLEPDHVSLILYRALQSGILALQLPASFQNKPIVMHAMPLAGEGTPPLPSIAFNETFMQEEEYRIGENVDDDQRANQFQVAAQAIRHYTVFVLAANVKEREYYKDAVIAIYNSILGPVLNKIGNNSRHRFQTSSSQVVGRANEPGFYFAEILLEFTGLYSVGVTTTYGPIDSISFNPVEALE
jgi:hypothetical protein